MHCVGPQTHTQETHTHSHTESLHLLLSCSSTTPLFKRHQHPRHHHPYPLFQGPLAAFRAICSPAPNPLLHPFNFSRSSLSLFSSSRLQISRKMLCQRKLLFVAEGRKKKSKVWGLDSSSCSAGLCAQRQNHLNPSKTFVRLLKSGCFLLLGSQTWL